MNLESLLPHTAADPDQAQPQRPQPGERWLAGQVRIAPRLLSTDELEQGIVAEGVGVVLAGVAGGNLDEAPQP